MSISLLSKNPCNKASFMQYATELAGDTEDPFIAFWSVFTQGTCEQFENHPNYKLFAPFFFDTMDMIKPRVLFVLNQDLCRLLNQGRGISSEQATRMMVVTS
jgi:hypothetical protein